MPAASLLADIEERFRRLLLQRLNRAERLSEAFLNNLLGWNPSGFSVYAHQLVFTEGTMNPTDSKGSPVT